MNVEGVKRVLSDVNSFLRRQPWMDFEVKQYQSNQLIVEGCLSPSYPNDILIVFDDVTFVSMPCEWKSDTERAVLVLLEGEEAKRLNMMFRVEQGHHIFKFIPEYYPESFGCLIGAKSISFHTT